jgi:hypothetical protein
MGARRIAEEAAALEAKVRRGEAIAFDELALAIDEAKTSLGVVRASGAPPSFGAPPPEGALEARTTPRSGCGFAGPGTNQPTVACSGTRYVAATRFTSAAVTALRLSI